MINWEYDEKNLVILDFVWKHSPGMCTEKNILKNVAPNG